MFDFTPISNLSSNEARFRKKRQINKVARTSKCLEMNLPLGITLVRDKGSENKIKSPALLFKRS